MKLLFDTQIFDWQINGGISRYFVELITRLDNNPDTEIIFNCTHSYNTYLQNTKWLKTSPKFKRIDFKGKLTIVKKVNQVVNRRFSNDLLESDSQDLFHPTYYDPYFLNHIGKKPFVLTVYDLTIEKFDDGSALTQTVLGWKKELISKAEHIISISENTKEDIISYYSVRPDKITTIYLAGGFDFVIDDKNNTIDGVNKAYILFVGSRNAYKNFNQFVVEVADLLHQYDLQLVVAGGGQLNADEIALLKALNAYNRVVAVSHVSDQYLAQLYSNAMVFVFPSLYEGFGIPVLEAMQCQCPTLLSNNSSLPEVGENAAQYFDPLTKGDLKKALEQLILNEELRAEMKVKGLEQSKKFNWQSTADKHALVYQRILANQKPI